MCLVCVCLVCVSCMCVCVALKEKGGVKVSNLENPG